MGSFMRSKNGMILIIAGIIIIGGLVGITIYYATSVHPNNESATPPNPSTNETETTSETSSTFSSTPEMETTPGMNSTSTGTVETSSTSSSSPETSSTSSSSTETSSTSLSTSIPETTSETNSTSPGTPETSSTSSSNPETSSTSSSNPETSSTPSSSTETSSTSSSNPETSSTSSSSTETSSTSSSNPETSSTSSSSTETSSTSLSTSETNSTSPGTPETSSTSSSSTETSSTSSSSTETSSTSSITSVTETTSETNFTSPGTPETSATSSSSSETSSSSSSNAETSSTSSSSTETSSTSSSSPGTEATSPSTPGTGPQTSVVLASTENGQIIMLDIIQENFTTPVNEEIDDVTTFEYYHREQNIFYGTNKNNKTVNWSNHENYYGSSLNYSRKWRKTAMAVDYTTGKIYLLDGTAEKLYMMDMNSDHYAVVLTDLDQPKDILLDCNKSLMFILQEHSILAAYMDGRGVRKIVELNTNVYNLKAFAIDRTNAILYYATYDEYVRGIDYMKKSTVYNVFEIHENIISMAVFEDRFLYISERKNDTSKSLRYCLLSERCAEIKTVTLENKLISSLSQIKAYDFIQDTFVNPCEKNNGECGHLCVLTSSNIKNYTCKCHAGWQLNRDSKTCSIVEDYLMYFQSNKLKGRTLSEEESFVDMDLNDEQDILNPEASMNFDYDAYEKLLVYTDESIIRYKNLSDHSSWVIFDDPKCEVNFAIDWASKNLYNMKNCYGKKSYLTVRKVNEISEDEKKLMDYDGNVNSFAVLPNQGKIVFTYYDQSLKKTILHLVNLNGTDWIPLQGYEASETALTVDPENGFIYYLYPPTKQVFEMDLELSLKPIIQISSVKNPKSIRIFQGQLYVANSTEIWRFEKDAPEKAVRIMQVRHDIQNFRVYSEKLQPIDKKQPCAINNGGCQRYCFAVPKDKTQLIGECGCNDNETLLPDKKTCSTK